MSRAFQHHGFELSEFQRCERDGAPLMQVHKDAKPVCLLEWLVERTGERVVEDVIPRGRGKYDLPAVVLEGGFVLPVERAIEVVTGNMNAEVNLSLAGWRVSDILYMPGEPERVSVELLPPGAVVDEDPGVLLVLHMDILLFMLWDEEVDRYVP